MQSAPKGSLERVPLEADSTEAVRRVRSVGSQLQAKLVNLANSAPDSREEYGNYKEFSKLLENKQVALTGDNKSGQKIEDCSWPSLPEAAPASTGLKVPEPTVSLNYARAALKASTLSSAELNCSQAGAPCPQFQLMGTVKSKRTPPWSVNSLCKGNVQDRHPAPIVLPNIDLEHLKVLAARALKRSPLADKLDHNALRKQLGDWYPPMPTPAKQAKILKDGMKYGIPVSWPGMSRAQKRKARRDWRAVLEGKKVSKPAVSLGKDDPKKAFCNLAKTESAEAVAEEIPDVEEQLHRDPQLKRNGNILFKGSLGTAKEIRKYRPL